MPLPELTVISWRDIPAQVLATDGKRDARAGLTDRFLLAIDEAAMSAGLSGSDDYLAEWKRTTRECSSDLEREVADEVERLEEAFPPDLLEQLAESGGREVDGERH
jgi:Virulence factor